MMSLTQRQDDCLRFIERYVDNNGGKAPTQQEIADGLGLSSKGGANRLIDALVHRGLLRRYDHRARALEVISRVPTGADLARLSDADLTLLTNRLEIETFARKRKTALERVL